MNSVERYGTIPSGSLVSLHNTDHDPEDPRTGQATITGVKSSDGMIIPFGMEMEVSVASILGSGVWVFDDIDAEAAMGPIPEPASDMIQLTLVSVTTGENLTLLGQRRWSRRDAGNRSSQVWGWAQWDDTESVTSISGVWTKVIAGFAKLGFYIGAATPLLLGAAGGSSYVDLDVFSDKVTAFLDDLGWKPQTQVDHNDLYELVEHMADYQEAQESLLSTFIIDRPTDQTKEA